ncbi:hypothetical protein BKA56DRAFT_107553 [Ilyonectria sp. MPI-CAGE-AT-0026]|nr:hypothetical protein BKA56DRAFT_107553 [Ilyonectria sp. MPI-CAGE-AT-0026]
MKLVKCTHPTVPFIIPKELLNAVPRISSSLVRLPPEVLHNVFSHVTDPIDQVCLALTCKHLLQASSSLVMKIPSVAKLGDLRMLLCHRMDTLLRSTAAPLDVLGQPRDMSVPCQKCLRSRPARRSHWKEEGERFALMEPRTDAREIWNLIVLAWAIRYSPLCPACLLEVRRELEEKGDSQPDVPGITSLPKERCQLEWK